MKGKFLPKPLDIRVVCCFVGIVLMCNPDHPTFEMNVAEDGVGVVVVTVLLL